MTDGLAGDHSEGAPAGRAELERRRIEAECDHDFQWHPQSEDFGVCSKCGADYANEQLTAFVDETFLRWSPDEELLAGLEQMLDRDDELGGSAGLGVFSPEGARAMRTAVARQRERNA